MASVAVAAVAQVSVCVCAAARLVLPRNTDVSCVLLSTLATCACSACAAHELQRCTLHLMLHTVVSTYWQGMGLGIASLETRV